jgi:hypothetical protein
LVKGDQQDRPLGTTKVAGPSVTISARIVEEKENAATTENAPSAGLQPRQGEALNMRRVLKWGLLAGTLLSVWIPAPVIAQSSYSILVPRPIFDSTSAAWVASCSSAYVDSKLNGIDSVVIDIHQFRNKPLALTWHGDSHLADAIGGSLDAAMYTSQCGLVPGTTTFTKTQGAWTLQVPGTASWLVMASENYANVSITI